MRVLLSLGSNLGDRRDNLRAAVEMLAATEGVTVTKVSSVYETEPMVEPMGDTRQPMFLNATAEVETVLEPLELLDALKKIERQLGRVTGPRWGPRVMDVDIILWESRTLEAGALTVPHREFRNRAFVLTPLAEIAPDARDPVTGLTVAELAARPEAAGRVTKLGEVTH